MESAAQRVAEGLEEAVMYSPDLLLHIMANTGVKEALRRVSKLHRDIVDQEVWKLEVTGGPSLRGVTRQLFPRLRETHVATISRSELERWARQSSLHNRQWRVDSRSLPPAPIWGADACRHELHRWYSLAALLPEGLGTLTSLEHLTLVNHLEVPGGLPEGLTSLTRLRKLQLVGWEGVDRLPSGLSALSALTALGLVDFDVLTELPRALGGLS